MRILWPSLILLGLILVPSSASALCCPPPVIQLFVGNCTISTSDGDVHSWGVKVRVGGTDDLCLVPSTFVSDTFLASEDVCSANRLQDANKLNLTSAQCRSRRGGFIPNGHPLQAASTDGIAEANPNWNASGNEIKTAAKATLEFLDEQVTMIVPLITDAQNSAASHLGLDLGSVVLKILKDKALVVARSFGLDVGSQSTSFPRSGSLILGGYDKSRFSASSKSYPVAMKPLSDRSCPFQVRVSNITLSVPYKDRNTNQTTQTPHQIVYRSDITSFCIEPCVKFPIALAHRQPAPLT